VIGLPPESPQRRRSTDRPVEMPYGMRLAAAWSWRSIVILFALYLVLQVLAKLEVLIVPVLVAMLVVALVRPVYEQLHDVTVGRWRVPPALAAIVTMLVTLAIVAGLLALIGQQVATGFPSLRDQASAGLDELQDWLRQGPLHISADQLSQWVDQVQARTATG
jgi:putative heme transporter